MDIVSTALSNAWLEAAARIQAQRTERPPIPREERTLTHAIERVMRHGSLDPLDAEWVDPTRPRRLVDRLV
jgi:hypothetical protein